MESYCARQHRGGCLHGFKGHKAHSARWDWSYDFSHKRVAIIGSGSSAIQILPQLAKVPTTSIVSFQRTPNWIIPEVNPGNLLAQRGENGRPDYTNDDRERFRNNSEELYQYRKSLHDFSHRSFRMVASAFCHNQYNPLI